MHLRYSRYSLHKGVQKIKTKTALVLSTLVLAVAGTSGMAVLTFGTAHAAKPDTGVTIQSGNLKDSTGATITTGYDSWGYNYQAHMFNGKYCDSYRDADWCQPYKDVNLTLKWNDAWLSNMDKNSDGLLDRHYGNTTYIGSGAWVTNHQSESYVDDSGNKQSWNYFSKIVAAPAGAILNGGFWYSADGTVIGPEIWGDFAIIQEVSNDTGTGDHGLLTKSALRSGLGNWQY